MLGQTRTARKKPDRSYWFDRFQAERTQDGTFVCRDWLCPPARSVDRARTSGLRGADLDAALFQHGLIRPAVSTFGSPVRNRPANAEDTLFWQYPCLTEAAAWEVHQSLEAPQLENNEMHVYLGMPWATWIDLVRKNATGSSGSVQIAFQLQMLRIRLSGQRAALAELGIRLRVHTVCQHIYWRDMVQAWSELGVTDLWLSHLPDHGDLDVNGMVLHPWSLYAVNVRDEHRRSGLETGKDPEQKKVLASFIGTHAAHYISEVRLRLRDLASAPGFVVRLTDKWHFEEVVYSEQMMRTSPVSPTDCNSSVTEYNALLSDSVFSLCPSGAGPNTLRLWESLAAGSIPVLLGPAVAMPSGGSLPDIDWDSIVVRIPDEKLAELPAILRAMPMDEMRRRQRAGLDAHAQVARQRCFQC
ncbi:MAG TPA: exostosin family protein [Telluria sp.]|nr:exostosin family protein [Telluria sp.]